MIICIVLLSPDWLLRQCIYISRCTGVPIKGTKQNLYLGTEKIPPFIAPRQDIATSKGTSDAILGRALLVKVCVPYKDNKTTTATKKLAVGNFLFYHALTQKF